MIDHFFKFNSATEALNDALALTHGQYDRQGIKRWATDHVLLDVNAWRPSQDTQQPIMRGDRQIIVTVHNYLPGWFCIIAMDQANDDLITHPNLQFALDRDGPPYVVVNKIGVLIQDIAVEPIFAGSHYPTGGIG